MLRSVDLSCLCNDLVRSVQDVDDAFAIRLGMLLCETVVLVHDGDCLYSLHQNVEELLSHLNSVAQIERQEEGQKSRGVVRCTRDVFVVVNFKNRSAASSEHVNLISMLSLFMVNKRWFNNV